MKKYYIAIINGKVVGNWGGEKELPQDTIEKICGGKPDELREVQISSAISTGWPISAYDANWQLLPEEQRKGALAKAGFDEHGKLLPTSEEQAAKAEKEALQAELQRQEELRYKASSFVAREEEAARQQAIDELLGDRPAEILAASSKHQYIETARKNVAAFTREADDLGLKLKKLEPTSKK